MLRSWFWQRRMHKLQKKFRRENFPLQSALILTDNPDIPDESFLVKFSSVTGIEKAEIEIVFVDKAEHPRFFDLQPKQMDFWGNIKDQNIRKLFQRPGLLLLDLMRHDTLFKTLVSVHGSPAFRIGIDERPDLFDLVIVQPSFSGDEFLTELEKYWHSLT